MKLFEYQAKELFEENQIPVPRRRLIREESGLQQALDEIGFPCVIKAQILEGGRGKAGLIQLAASGEEAHAKTKQIFASPKKVSKVLIEEAVHIAKELYLSITLDPVAGSSVIMACAEGGVDIEEIARSTPDKIIRESVDIARGLSPFQARNLMYDLGLDGPIVSQGSKLLLNLYGLFQRYDCELVEINPLMITSKGNLVAADGKISLDDNSLFRHERFELTREYFDSDAQYEASQEGIPYLEFDGDIGLMCAGAGLTNTVFDLIHYYGGTVSNYLEFGGPNYHKAVQAMTIMMKSNPKVILIVTFGTIARADVMAQGLVDAVKLLKPEIPIVAAIRGTGEEEAHRLLRSIGLQSLDETEEAVKQAIALAGGVGVK
ncbi:succinate--CoA ligase subunit beta [Ferviditalea candida]|uniref:ATP-grasp domain-containing protein n=1 Tax=Ferviditalea candida TaxID=3108399 RepID=A0ABU5ZEN3_9BACL|nr:ATP-grasp domain-containing protein [Paenibacillaceae bacterium T2]